MDYEKIYDNLMSSRKLFDRMKKRDGTYFENHHIIPRCFGGPNTKENLVLLTYKEHFLAHLLLVRMYSGKEKAKMAFALLNMCKRSVRIDGERITSTRQYEIARKIYSESMKGIPKTTEHKRNLSIARIGQEPWNKGLKFKKDEIIEVHDAVTEIIEIKEEPKVLEHPDCARPGKKNGMHGRSLHDLWTVKYGIEEADRRRAEMGKKLSKSNKGKKRSKEFCDRMSVLNIGRKVSDLQKKHISDTLKGRKLPEDHKKAISEGVKKTYSNIPVKK